MDYELSEVGSYKTLVEPMYYVTSIASETNWTAIGTVANIVLAFLTLITTICVVWAGWSAQRSAKVATQSLKLAQDSSRRQLRAYLVADGGIVTGRENRTQDNVELDCVYVKVVMANTGQTPASNITCSVLGTKTPNRDVGAGRLLEFEFAQTRAKSASPTPITIHFSYTDCYGEQHDATISFIVTPAAAAGSSLIIYNTEQQLIEVAGDLLGKTALPLDQHA